eukprot:Hpha_TRINITY_DN16018_c0_g1::TRINITY_DN16018_c0_g1_i1::g.118148::m.118148
MPGRAAKRKRGGAAEGDAGSFESLANQFEPQLLVAALPSCQLQAPSAVPLIAPGHTLDPDEAVRVTALAEEWTLKRSRMNFASLADLLPLLPPAAFSSTYAHLASLAAGGDDKEWERQWEALAPMIATGLCTLTDYVAQGAGHGDVGGVGAALCRYVHLAAACARVPAVRATPRELGPAACSVTRALVPALDAAALLSHDAYRTALGSARSLGLAVLRSEVDAVRAATLDAATQLISHPYRVGDDTEVSLAALDSLRDETTTQLCQAASTGQDETVAWAAAFFCGLAGDATERTAMSPEISSGKAALWSAIVRASAHAVGTGMCEDGELGGGRAQQDTKDAKQQCSALALLAAIAEVHPACVSTEVPQLLGLLRSPHGTVRKACAALIGAAVAALGGGCQAVVMAAAEALADAAEDSDSFVACRAVQEIVRVGGAHVWEPDAYTRCLGAVAGCAVAKQGKVRLAAWRAISDLLVRNPLTSTLDAEEIARDVRALKRVSGSQSEGVRHSLQRAADFVGAEVEKVRKHLQVVLQYLASRTRMVDMDAGCLEAIDGLLSGESESEEGHALLLSLRVDPLDLSALLRYCSDSDGPAGDSKRGDVRAVISHAFGARYLPNGGTVEEIRRFCCWSRGVPPEQLGKVAATSGAKPEVLGETATVFASDLERSPGLSVAGLLLINSIDEQIVPRHSAAVVRALQRAMDAAVGRGAVPEMHLQLANAARLSRQQLGWFVQHPVLLPTLGVWPELTLRLVVNAGVDPREVLYPALLALEAGDGEGAGERVVTLLRVLAAGAELCRGRWQEEAETKWDGEQRELSTSQQAEEEEDGYGDAYMRDTVISRGRREFTRRYVGLLFEKGVLSRYLPLVLSVCGAEDTGEDESRVRMAALCALRPFALATPGVVTRVAPMITTRARQLCEGLRISGDRWRCTELCAVCDAAAFCSACPSAPTADFLNILTTVMLWNGDQSSVDSSDDSSSSVSHAEGVKVRSSAPPAAEMPRVRALAAVGEVLKRRCIASPAQTLAQIAQCLCEGGSTELPSLAAQCVLQHIANDAMPGASFVALFRALPSQRRRRAMLHAAELLSRDATPQVSQSCATALAASAAELGTAVLSTPGGKKVRLSPDAAAFSDALHALVPLPSSDGSLSTLVTALSPLAQEGDAGEQLRRDMRHRLPPSAFSDLRTIIARAAPGTGTGAGTGKTPGRAKRAARAEALLTALEGITPQRGSGGAGGAAPKQRRAVSKRMAKGPDLEQYERILNDVRGVKEGAASLLPTI